MRKLQTTEFYRRSYIYKKYPNRIVTLVTKDTNMRLKADALGIPAEDYLQSSNKLESGFTGVTNITVSADVIEVIYRQKKYHISIFWRDYR